MSCLWGWSFLWLRFTLFFSAEKMMNVLISVFTKFCTLLPLKVNHLSYAFMFAEKLEYTQTQPFASDASLIGGKSNPRKSYFTLRNASTEVLLPSKKCLWGHHLRTSENPQRFFLKQCLEDMRKSRYLLSKNHNQIVWLASQSLGLSLRT